MSFSSVGAMARFFAMPPHATSAASLFLKSRCLSSSSSLLSLSFVFLVNLFFLHLGVACCVEAIMLMMRPLMMIVIILRGWWWLRWWWLSYGDDDDYDYDSDYDGGDDGHDNDTDDDANNDVVFVLLSRGQSSIYTMSKACSNYFKLAAKYAIVYCATVASPIAPKDAKTFFFQSNGSGNVVIVFCSTVANVL